MASAGKSKAAAPGTAKYAFTKAELMDQFDKYYAQRRAQEEESQVDDDDEGDKERPREKPSTSANLEDC